MQKLEKEINNIAKILDQKLDNIPIIVNSNFNLIKSKINDNKIKNSENTKLSINKL